jgi:hypothetical protein
MHGMWKAVAVLVVTLGLLIGNNAAADTEYQFNGNMCQPYDPSDAAYFRHTGAGSDNSYGNPGASTDYVCAVDGLENRTLHPQEYKIRFYKGRTNTYAAGGYWQINNLNNGAITYTSAKYVCGTDTTYGCTSNGNNWTGNAWVSWRYSQSELPYSISSYSQITFRGAFPAYDPDDIGSVVLQAYLAKHTES